MSPLKERRMIDFLDSLDDYIDARIEYRRTDSYYDAELIFKRSQTLQLKLKELLQ